MMTVLTIWAILIIALLASLFTSRTKTLLAAKAALRALWRSAPSLLLVIGLVGLTLGFLSEETIGRLLGEEAGFLGTLGAALIGSITVIPSLVAFPLAASLLRSGSSVVTIAAFITTLTMVGIATAPMEIQHLGRRFTLLRSLSFIAALILAVVMGVLV